MQFLLCWLGITSSQIQAVAGVAAVIVAAIVAVVAWKQKLAAEAQAKAAIDQTAAAKEQALAAKEQVIAAKQQTETSFRIADIQTSPHISITPAQNHIGVLLKGQVAFLNNGNGVAANLRLKYRDGLPGDDLQISAQSLVIRDSFNALIDEGRAAKSGLVLTYTTIFGSKCSLEFQWNGLISKAINERLTIEYAESVK
jgi:hypothetical protein